VVVGDGTDVEATGPPAVDLRLDPHAATTKLRVGAVTPNHPRALSPLPGTWRRCRMRETSRPGGLGPRVAHPINLDTRQHSENDEQTSA
jgi:hypothetical protein